MFCLRRKVFVAFLFVLISMGQGFALSYVINQPQLKDLQINEGIRAVPAHLLICGRGFQKILRENPKPHQKSHEELFSLRSDPFMPVFYFSPLPVMETVSVFLEFFLIPEWKASPPDKPPRFFS